MSEMAKKARAAMKAKASSLTAASSSADPHQKVDSSTWTPPEPLNTEAKTGLRPVSRRAYKTGGKVHGHKAKANMGKKPRASGGKAITADSFINRNVKEANDKRAGEKHVGGMKKGGRAEKCGGGSAKRGKYANRGAVDRLRDWAGMDSPDYAPKSTGKSTYTPPSDEDRDALAAMSAKASDTRSNQEAQRKHGGRTKREYGGPLAGASRQMQMAQQQAGVPSALMNFTGIKKGSLSPMRASGMKKGGAAHEDIAADKALIRKMVKPSARTGKQSGGTMGPLGMPRKGTSEDIERGLARDMLSRADAEAKIRAARLDNLSDPSLADSFGPAKSRGSIMFPEDRKSGGRTKVRSKHADGGSPSDRRQQLGKGYQAGLESQIGGPQGGIMGRSSAAPPQELQRYGEQQSASTDYKKGGRTKRKDGGQVFSGPSYPGKVPGEVPGGRTAHASGGKAGKGKTNVNIVIAAGKPAGASDMMPPTGPVPPPGMGKPPGGVPVPVPPAAGMPAGGMPMGMPMPMPMPSAAPAGAPPAPRKDGGRLTKKAHSYKDMEAGAGSGEGRLQKTDIAKRPMHNKGGKVGHRNYRNYKDMDAGAGSGLGRKEKTEIAGKHTGIQRA